MQFFTALKRSFISIWAKLVRQTALLLSMKKLAMSPLDDHLVILVLVCLTAKLQVPTRQKLKLIWPTCSSKYGTDGQYYHFSVLTCKQKIRTRITVQKTVFLFLKSNNFLRFGSTIIRTSWNLKLTRVQKILTFLQCNNK